MLGISAPSHALVTTHSTPSDRKNPNNKGRPPAVTKITD